MGDKYNIKEGIQKFPSFHYKELSDLISKQEIFSKEITIDSLKELKNLLFQLDKEITNLVDTNYNIFKRKVESYNRKTYYFLIFSKMAILLSDIIIHKLEPIKGETFNFNSNEYIQELKDKYGKNEDFEHLLKRLNAFFEIIDNIVNSEHNHAISFLNICYNYLICFVKEILKEIKSFKEIKINNNEDYDLDNENLLLNLIFDLEKLQTICIFLGYVYFIDEKDIFNQNTKFRRLEKYIKNNI